MKVLADIAKPVASGLILYGVIWALENTGATRQRLLAAFDALAQAGTQWTQPLAITAVASAGIGLVAILAGHLLPVPPVVGLERTDAVLVLGRLGKLLLGLALVIGLAASSFLLMAHNLVSGVTLLGVASLLAAGWTWRVARRMYRFWNASVY